MKKNIFRKIFGKKFNIWDMILILLVVPYIYLVYMGIEYESGLKAIYYRFLAIPLTFLLIGRYFISFIIKKQKK